MNIKPRPSRRYTYTNYNFIPYTGTNAGDDRTDRDESYKEYIERKKNNNIKEYIEFVKKNTGEDITEDNINIIPEIMVKNMEKYKIITIARQQKLKKYKEQINKLKNQLKISDDPDNKTDIESKIKEFEILYRDAVDNNTEYNKLNLLCNQFESKYESLSDVYLIRHSCEPFDFLGSVYDDDNPFYQFSYMIKIFERLMIIINNIYLYKEDNYHDESMFYWIAYTETDPEYILSFFEIKNDLIYVLEKTKYFMERTQKAFSKIDLTNEINLHETIIKWLNDLKLNYENKEEKKQTVFSINGNIQAMIDHLEEKKYFCLHPQATEYIIYEGSDEFKNYDPLESKKIKDDTLEEIKDGTLEEIKKGYKDYHEYISPLLPRRFEVPYTQPGYDPAGNYNSISNGDLDLNTDSDIETPRIHPDDKKGGKQRRKTLMKKCQRRGVKRSIKKHKRKYKSIKRQK